MTDAMTMSPEAYREARAALLREPIQASKPAPQTDGKHAAGMTDEEYQTARFNFLHGA